MDDSFEWNEDLPNNCPPEDAFNPNGGVFYRLVESYPPNEIDFHSTRKRSPERKVLDECAMKACSLYSSYEACDKTRKTYSRFKKMVIVAIMLPPESGLILQTFNDNHFSWWMFKGFDPLAYCQKV